MASKVSQSTALRLTDQNKAAALKMSLRALWSGHAFSMRNYIVAAIAGSPSADEASSRLLRNQNAIGQSIVPYYGATAGDQMASLLQEHVLIAADLVDAAAANKGNKVIAAQLRWDVNANALAAFLGAANPHWPESDVADLLSTHLQLTRGQVAARLATRWDDEANAFDDTCIALMTLADAMADGIVKQFPDRF